MKISRENFGTLCICAIRYCHGRQTYMPSLVQGIVTPRLKELSNKDLAVVLDDCNFQRTMRLYGDVTIDKPGWLLFEQKVHEEVARRALEKKE